MEKQLLKHGKALCGKVFGGFVDTFNWLVRFCSNIRGDKDVSDANGHITVDLSDPDHPVIRCSGCSDSSGSNGGSKCPHGKKLETHELTYVDDEGDEHVYHGMFCDDIDIPEVKQKTIVAGPGISVSESDGIITISNTRESSSGDVDPEDPSGDDEDPDTPDEGEETDVDTTVGFTGVKTVVASVSYDENSHQLQMHLEDWSFSNGLLKSVTPAASPTTITTAVEETATDVGGDA